MSLACTGNAQGLLHVSFNQDGSCLALATREGLRIYSVDAHAVVYKNPIGAIRCGARTRGQFGNAGPSLERGASSASAAAAAADGRPKGCSTAHSSSCAPTERRKLREVAVPATASRAAPAASVT
jgi:hypothetical protein